MKRIVAACGIGLLSLMATVGNVSALVYNYGPYDGSVKVVGQNFTTYELEWEVLPDAALLSLIDLDAYFSGAKSITQSGTFESFCMEQSEYVQVQNTPYSVTLDDRAVGGSVGAAGDPLSRGTAWLYEKFATGDWTGVGNDDFAYGAGRAADVYYLQHALWWLEGEISDPGSYNPFRNLVISEFGSSALAMQDNLVAGTYYGSEVVKVMNLWSQVDVGEARQDMLVLVRGTDPGNPVPDAGLTVSLLGIALVGMGLISRRMGA